ncbi:hypothetical protein QQ045_004628 [Rhodiola kirilowii]
MATSLRRRERIIGSDQVRSDYVLCSGGILRSGCGNRRRGKAQLSLERILSVIASRGGSEVGTEEVVVVVVSGGRGGGVDLNLEAVGVGESAAVGGVELQSSGEGCGGGLGMEEAVDSAALVDVIAGGSDGVVSIGQEHSSSDDVVKDNRVPVGDGDGGYLGLLIEAAQLVADGCEAENVEKYELGRTGESNRSPGGLEPDGSIKKSLRRERRSRQHWLMEEDLDISPLVRSKRGRTQVLPYRYRDSVIESLGRRS